MPSPAAGPDPHLYAPSTYVAEFWSRLSRETRVSLQLDRRPVNFFFLFVCLTHTLKDL